MFNKVSSDKRALIRFDSGGGSSGPATNNVDATARAQASTALARANEAFDDAQDRPVGFEEFGAVGDGVTDDTAAILAAEASGRPLKLTQGMIHRQTADVTLTRPLKTDGGIIKLDDGVTLTANIDAGPGIRIFDITSLTPVQGQAWNQHFHVWSMNGGLKTTGTVHASWFGADEAKADNSFEIQCALDATNYEVGIDGDYTYTAAFYNAAAVISTKPKLFSLAAPVATRAVLSQVIQTKTYDGTNADPALNAWGEPRCFGMFNKSGIVDGVFERIHFDGRNEQQFDFADDLNNFRSAGGGFDKFKCNCSSLVVSEQATAEANGYVRAPDGMTVIDCWFEGAIRNGIVGNRAKRMRVLGGGGRNSSMDHICYFDENPDTVVVDFTLRGYAESAMAVFSGVTATRLVCDNIAQNPHTDVNTGSIVGDRSDVDNATVINDPRFKADFSNLAPTEVDRKVFISYGKHRLRIIGGSIENTGADDGFGLWGTGDNTALSYTAPEFNGVQFLNMSSETKLVQASGITVSNLRWLNGLWRYRDDATAQVGELILVGSLTRGRVESVLFDTFTNRGYNRFVRCDKTVNGDLLDFKIVNVDWNCSDNSEQWALVEGVTERCQIIASWLRVGRPSDRGVKWRDSYYGSSRNPTHQLLEKTFTGNGTDTLFTIEHAIGNAPYYADAQALNGFGGVSEISHVIKRTNALDIMFLSPPQNDRDFTINAIVDLTGMEIIADTSTVTAPTISVTPAAATITEGTTGTVATITFDNGGDTGVVPTVDGTVFEINGNNLDLIDAAVLADTGQATLTITNSAGTDTATFDLTVNAASSDTVTLTDIAGNRVFQYGEGGTTASVPVAGAYTGSPTSIQARLVLASDSSEVVGWTTIDASPTGSAYSGQLTVPRGGPYRLEVRSEAGNVVTGTTTFSVGLVVLAYGQSNTEDMFVTQSSAPAASANTFYFDRDTDSWGAVPNANGVRQLMNDLVAGLGYPVGVLNASSPGAISGAFVPPGGFSYTDKLQAQIPVVEDFGVVITYQGEGDADGVSTKANWKSNWLQAQTELEALIPRATLPMIFSSLSTFGGPQSTITDAEWWDIQEGIRELTSEQADMYFSHSTMDSPRIDDYHHSAANLQIFGARFAETILKVLGVQATGVAPVILDATKASGTTTTINITHDGGSDITPTTSITGFEVSDDNATWIAATGARADADTITLTHAALGATANDDRYVRYLYGTLPNISGVVLDDTGAPLLNSASQLLVDYAIPEMTSPTTASSMENLTYVQNLTVSRPSTFAISGADAALFQVLNSNELHFIAAPDFEAPGDAGADNTYNITVTPTALDNGDVGVTQNVAVTVTDDPAEAGSSYVFAGAELANTGPTSHTMNVDLGSASADRLVLVGVSNQNGDNVAPVVTAAGEQLDEISFQLGVGYGIGFYAKLLPTGSGNQDVTVVWDDADFERKLMSVWVLRGLSSNSPQAAPVESMISTGTTLPVAAGDMMFMMEATSNNAGTTDLSGSTEAPDGWRLIDVHGSSADWIIDATNANLSVEGYAISGNRAFIRFQ